MLLPQALTDLRIWASLDSQSRNDMARSLKLPVPLSYVGLEWHSQGGERYEIAFYEGCGGRFALLPGGRHQLGYDLEHPFVPTEEQLASYNQALEFFSFLGNIEDCLAWALRPLRTVTITPFLIETEAVAPGTGWMVQGPSRTDEDERKWIQAKQASRRMTYRELMDELAASGFRPPTIDEWEYACRAGTSTLFRWGDQTPNCYPGPDCAFEPAHQPNAFGLHIATDPYDWEISTNPAVMVGGDGGGTVCGGMGFILSWLPLASAFSQEGLVLTPDTVLGGESVRRVCPLR